MSDSVNQNADDIIEIGHSDGPANCAVVENVSIGFSQLIEMVGKAPVGPKDGSYYVRGPSSDGHRSNASISRGSLLIIDGDKRFDPETGEVSPSCVAPALVHEALREMDVPHVLHTSHSHDPANGINKFRVLIPCQINGGDQLHAMADWILAELQKHGLHIVLVKEMLSMAQPWYYPRRRSENAPFESWSHELEDPSNALSEKRVDSITAAWKAQGRDTRLPEGRRTAFDPSTPIGRFLNAHDSAEYIIDLLENHGCTFVRSEYVNGHPAYRLIPPNSSSGLAGIHVFRGRENGRWLIHSHNDSFRIPSGTVDAFGLYQLLEHGDDQSLAIQAALNMERENHQRRREQINQDMHIGEGVSPPPVADQITLDVALKRFIYVGDGKGVFDRKYPTHFLDLNSHKQFFAASGDPDKKTRGNISAEWARHPERVSVMTRSFKAGAGTFIDDPDGRSAVNSWQGFDRTSCVCLKEHVDAFVGHVEFIFEKDAQRFLDWLAHIEQRPGKLPHTAWLSIATNTGLGRNWISSVLCRIWAGRVAANFDLLGMFERGFNGRLSGKILACVDEIKAGGNEAWPHSEKLKSIVTEETREINPKYGRQFVEHNAVRWLVFSNHLGAIPLEANDRRWEVVINEQPPMSPEYYSQLYALIEDPTFINSIAFYLSSRDISKFNSGAHAKANESKAHVINCSKSDIDLGCEAIVADWKSDIILTSDLNNALFGENQIRQSNVARSVMSRLGARSYGRQVKVEAKRDRAWILRNHEYWLKADPYAVAQEGKRGRVAS